MDASLLPALMTLQQGWRCMDPGCGFINAKQDPLCTKCCLDPSILNTSSFQSSPIKKDSNRLHKKDCHLRNFDTEVQQKSNIFQSPKSSKMSSNSKGDSNIKDLEKKINNLKAEIAKLQSNLNKVPQSSAQSQYANFDDNIRAILNLRLEIREAKKIHDEEDPNNTTEVKVRFENCLEKLRKIKPQLLELEKMKDDIRRSYDFFELSKTMIGNDKDGTDLEVHLNAQVSKGGASALYSRLMKFIKAFPKNDLNYLRDTCHYLNNTMIFPEVKSHETKKCENEDDLIKGLEDILSQIPGN